MPHTHLGGRIELAEGLTLHRMGYGAMQLAGPGVFGPPKDRERCLAVLRTAVELGIDHIDTSDFYGPYVTNEIIKEALHPYPSELTLVTKVGARRDEQGGWHPALAPDELKQAVHDNLEHLGLDALDIVNLRLSMHGDGTESVAQPLGALRELQEQGLIKHLGLSECSEQQLDEALGLAPIVTVQNLYNLANRKDDALVDRCARENIAYAAYFPLGGFDPLQSDRLDAVAKRLGASAQQVALAWLLQRSPSIVLIPGTSSVEHLRENIAAAELELPADAVAELDAIGG